MSGPHTPLAQPGVIDCSCGSYRQEGIYSVDFGARVAFLQHVVESIAAENDWPDTFEVDGHVAVEE